MNKEKQPKYRKYKAIQPTGKAYRIPGPFKCPVCGFVEEWMVRAKGISPSNWTYVTVFAVGPVCTKAAYHLSANRGFVYNSAQSAMLWKQRPHLCAALKNFMSGEIGKQLRADGVQILKTQGGSTNVAQG